VALWLSQLTRHKLEALHVGILNNVTKTNQMVNGLSARLMLVPHAQLLLIASPTILTTNALPFIRIKLRIIKNANQRALAILK